MVASRSFAEGHHDFDLARQAFGVEIEGILAVAVEDQVGVDFHVLLPVMEWGTLVGRSGSSTNPDRH
jgi:hypothetical protein